MKIEFDPPDWYFIANALRMAEEAYQQIAKNLKGQPSLAREFEKYAQRAKQYANVIDEKTGA